jgi:hypothetical protein
MRMKRKSNSIRRPIREFSRESEWDLTILGVKTLKEKKEGTDIMKNRWLVIFFFHLIEEMNDSRSKSQIGRNKTPINKGEIEHNRSTSQYKPRKERKVLFQVDINMDSK